MHEETIGTVPDFEAQKFLSSLQKSTQFSVESFLFLLLQSTLIVPGERNVHYESYHHYPYSHYIMIQSNCI